jgi:hypothetical protein
MVILFPNLILDDAIFGSIILWTITTWVTFFKLIKKEEKGFSSLKNVIHQQSVCSIENHNNTIGFSF